MNTPLPLDAAELDEIGARRDEVVTMQAPLSRPGYVPIDADERNALVAQSRAALTLAARVAELERELSACSDERRAEWVRAENAEGRVAELEAELAEAKLDRENFIALKELHLSGGRFDAAFVGEGVQIVAALLVQWFRDAGGPNYCGVGLVDSKTGEQFEMTLQRVEGKSPQVVAREFRERAEAAEATANALRDALEKVLPFAQCVEDHERGPDPCSESCGCEAAVRFAHESLSAHPAASLAAYRARVLEPYIAALSAWRAVETAEGTDCSEYEMSALRAEAHTLTTRALAAQAQEVKL